MTGRGGRGSFGAFTSREIRRANYWGKAMVSIKNPKVVWRDKGEAFKVGTVISIGNNLEVGNVAPLLAT